MLSREDDYSVLDLAEATIGSLVMWVYSDNLCWVSYFIYISSEFSIFDLFVFVRSDSLRLLMFCFVFIMNVMVEDRVCVDKGR